ncbi:dihydropteroate synthase [Flavobacterium aciduliphilum]|uniref:Dihydropteroate synthase n=1 Tax=Flavobacterium aciduliphilum TaxID=1101402 RepID=A0A328YKW3_9FLAO|nr:dihydropteroate synthase [Flavobacterium aciduliphilum]RAR70776.1 dihydropteroate synthase [Flavobacterium aciduliphilum]
MTLNCRGTLIDITTPKVMGILNITPNSFYDGGVYANELAILNRAEELLLEGATFIDLGAYSSKPNAEFVSEEEELHRIVPIVKAIVKHFPEALLSIDTFRSQVAERCLELGAALINDIAAGMLDEQMLPTVAKWQVPYIMMHMRGTPNTMQQNVDYDNLVKDILFYFSQRIALAKSFGINDIVIDPGFGFAKTTAQNFELLEKMELLKNIELPILVGLSRKSMIYKTLETTPAEALNGTTFLHAFALQKGANILRVHDVKEAIECITLFQNVQP